MPLKLSLSFLIRASVNCILLFRPVWFSCFEWHLKLWWHTTGQFILQNYVWDTNQDSNTSRKIATETYVTGTLVNCAKSQVKFLLIMWQCRKEIGALFGPLFAILWLMGKTWTWSWIIDFSPQIMTNKWTSIQLYDDFFHFSQEENWQAKRQIFQ